GFACVFGDDTQQRSVGDRHRRRQQPVGAELARYQVALGDLKLFLLRVASELNDLHAVAQGRRNRVEHVCGGDEQDTTQVKGLRDVVVAEGGILLRVENLEQRRCRVAARAARYLVDLIQHAYRVACAGLAQALHDIAGQGSDIGPPVATDLGFVVHAAQ